MRQTIPLHGASDHRANGPDGIPVLIHLPMPAATRRFVVTNDLAGTFLRSVHATLSTAGSSATELEVENVTNGDPLHVDPTQIDSGDTTSYSSGSPHSLDQSGSPPLNLVQLGDVLEVTATKGTGAADLVALLEFGPRVIRRTP